MAIPLVGLLRELVVPRVGAASLNERVFSSLEARIPFRADASELADELAIIITGWACEAHRLTGISAPLVIRDAVAADRGIGRLGVVEPVEARAMIGLAARWVRQHLPSIAYLGVVREMHDEIVPVVRRGIGKVGVLPTRPRVVPVECPVCFEPQVRVVWARGSTPNGRVECGHCHWVSERWSPEDWEV